MNLGDKLVEIRKENKMSQEKFAEELGVTRQTVSNWENYKNYPDICTIIKISDRFSISLDILLKGDKNMINKIDKEVKNNKKYRIVLITIAVVVIMLISAFGIYAVKYNNAKIEVEEKFNTALKENNFKKNVDGYYSNKYSDKITYSVPNQKMPSILDFSLDFYAKHLDCIIKLEDNKELRIRWIDYNFYAATLYDNEDRLTYVGLLNDKNKDQISIIKDKIDVDVVLLKEVINKGNSLYKDFYK